MQPVTIPSFLLVAGLATAMQAQTPTAKPDPELNKIHVWVGHWTFEGEIKPGPLMPAGKITGELDGGLVRTYRAPEPVFPQRKDQDC
jgi:hypothetical protein